MTITLLAGRARAEDVAPLVPAMDPPKAAEMVTRFHEALAGGLKAGGLSVMSPAVVRAKLGVPAEQAGCFEGPCLNVAVAAVGDRRLVTAKISTVGKNYQIEVRLYRGTKMLGKAGGRCDICTLAEALKATGSAATDIGSKAEEPPTTAVASSTATAKTAGPAAVKPETTSATSATSGSVEQPAMTETTQPPSATPATSERAWPLWPALVAAGVGVVGLSAGVPLLALDGDYTNCQGPPRADGRNCADLYATAAPGWVLTGMGIAGLAASGVLFYLHFSSKGTSQEQAAGLSHISLMPSARGMMAGVGGRF